LATGPKTLELAGRVADGVILLAELHVGHLAEDADAADMAKIVATTAELLESLAKDGVVVNPRRRVVAPGRRPGRPRHERPRRGRLVGHARHPAREHEPGLDDDRLPLCRRDHVLTG
jgi:nucleoside-diphosphate-sugar epimerase